MPCCLGINKVKGYWDLVMPGFCVWSNLCGGTASLKFRQFNSTFCDALGVFFGFWGVCGCMVCFGSVEVLGWCGNFAFGVLHAEFCGWGLLVCLVVGAGRKNIFCVNVFCFCVRVRLCRLTVLPGVWAFN